MRILDRILPRATDLIVGGLLATLLLPTVALAAAGRRFVPQLQQLPLLVRSRRLGARGKPFDLMRFGRGTPRRMRGLLHRARLSKLPIAFNLLCGDVTLVGPRPLRPTMAKFAVCLGRRPGLVRSDLIRRRTGTDFALEAADESEAMPARGWRADLALLARWLVVAWMPRARPTRRARVDILGIDVDNVNLDEAVERVVCALDKGAPTLSAFVNPHCLNVARRDPSYRAVLTGARHVFPDGFGLQLAGQLLGRPLRQNVNGTDLFPRLCHALEHKGHSVFLLGGQPGVAESVHDWIRLHYPRVSVCGTHHGHFGEADSDRVVRAVRDSGAELLLVARGVPLQETWLAENLAQTGAQVGIGVGGLFEFYSGRIPRAPRWMRDVGFEWAYRLLQEPRRLAHRYLVGNAVFLASVWRQRRREART